MCQIDMKPKLSEKPQEWRKFGLALAFVLAIAGFFLARRGVIAFRWIAATSTALALLVWAQPRLFRPLYRAAMTASFYIGQVIGRVILALIFLVILTPMGWLLRATGKDLLRLKRMDQQTYWHSSRNDPNFDRQF
jgi:hypothetical protein